MTIALKTFAVKDQTTSRDDILRVLKNGLILRGVPNPQLGFGTDAYLWATALSNEVAVLSANLVLVGEAQMIDTATGTDLDRIANIFGLSRRSAGGSSGFVTLSTAATTFIPVGTQLLDSLGQRFQVSVGGSYTNTTGTNQVPVAAIDGGKASNHASGDVLRWVSTPAYAAPTALVSTGGLSGGVDAENDETLRARVLSRLQNPPGSANWPQVALLAEAASTSVQKAFVYPAVNGPSTVHVVVVGYAQTTGTLTAASKHRDVDATLLASTITPYILGNLPEFVEVTVTTVTNVTNDVSIGLTLPAAASAVPSGPGGGWIDGTPWPDIRGTIFTFCSVSGVTSSTVITVNAQTAPTVGVSHVAFLDPTNWTLQRAKVIGSSGTTGAYTITLDTAWPNIATGNYVWPDSINAQTYANAVLAFFAGMGPGEKTSNSGVLSRGYRHPLPVNAWPMAVNAILLKAITNTGNEVLDAQYYQRGAVGNPAIPGAVANPPNIFVPNNVGFYQL